MGALSGLPEQQRPRVRKAGTGARVKGLAAGKEPRTEGEAGWAAMGLLHPGACGRGDAPRNSARAGALPG